MRGGLKQGSTMTIFDDDRGVLRLALGKQQPLKSALMKLGNRHPTTPEITLGFRESSPGRRRRRG